MAGNTVYVHMWVYMHTHIYRERPFTITHTHTHMHTYTVRSNDKEENHLFDTCRCHIGVTPKGCPWSYRPSKVHITSPKFIDSPLCATDLDNAEFLFYNSFFV